MNPQNPQSTASPIAPLTSPAWDGTPVECDSHPCDAKAIETALQQLTQPPSPWPPPPWPISLEVHRLLASTNATLGDRLRAGAPAGSCVLALAQSAGQGQRGRVWQSQPGGLYLSLGLRPALPADQGHRLTLGSAWGIATLLRSRGIPVQVKWPNDLVLGGKKLGGILTESRLQGGQIHQAIVGVGLNWRNPVPPWGIALSQALAEVPGQAAQGSSNPGSNPGSNSGPYSGSHAGPAQDPPQSRSHSVLAGQPSPGIESLESLAAIALTGLCLGYQTWCCSALPWAELSQCYDDLLWNRGCPVAIAGQMGILIGIAPTGELKVSMNQGTFEFPPGTINLGYD